MNDFRDTNRVLTLADLETGKGEFSPNSLAVLGHPIAHSLSPRMHNGALAALARSGAVSPKAVHIGDWRYHAFDIAPEDLARALRLLHARGFRGLNLTVPHKVLALREVAEIDPPARAVGAVNTLLRTEAGWRGFNTDGYGLAAAVREALGLDLGAQPVLLLGAGGAARGAAVECLQRGCPALWIANRSQENLETLLDALRPLAGQADLHGFAPANAIPPHFPEGALVINATALGLHEGDAAPINLKTLPRPISVYDMIYNPPETPLLRTARELGAPTANGAAMLVHQGAKALEIWSGISAEQIAPLMQAALRTQ
ncbi:shikimate dehydrogenase [Cephaloticoccus primus]|uniref:Shikimate dehydrogenase (NADP(+)) n=1 Tax=Cephaloticoccus primus TaxID=1548207 RepID=A0A139SN13_9BACT|nr:shikimate dehydrogenase [Cephaloticoccus primus]KXU35935.1 shikimate dehydrogenase [Cephaloticoccus primus]